MIGELGLSTLLFQHRTIARSRLGDSHLELGHLGFPLLLEVAPPLEFILALAAFWIGAAR
jgi:hypothetical protein